MTNSDKYRVTRFKTEGGRKTEYLSEEEIQKLRASKLQKIRKDNPGVTQKALAEAIGINLRTLQDW